MKHEKNTALELKEINGKIEVFVHTALNVYKDNKELSELEGTPILNPLDAIALFKDHSKKYQYIDDYLVQILWCNAEGKTGERFNDVALKDSTTGEYDAWLVGKVITEKLSAFSNSNVGTMHWFRTIVSEHSRIGEYLMNNDEFSTEILNSWGLRLHESSKELIEWSNKNNKID